MSEIDERIREGLDADDKEFLEQLESDRGLWRQIGDSLTGPMGGWAKLVFAMSSLLVVAIVLSVWQLLVASGTRDQILWGVLTISLFMAQGFLKDWLFSRMNMLNILREVKRLQVQVALLQAGESKA